MYKSKSKSNQTDLRKCQESFQLLEIELSKEPQYEEEKQEKAMEATDKFSQVNSDNQAQPFPNESYYCEDYMIEFEQNNELKINKQLRKQELTHLKEKISSKSLTERENINEFCEQFELQKQSISQNQGYASLTDKNELNNRGQTTQKQQTLCCLCSTLNQLRLEEVNRIQIQKLNQEFHLQNAKSRRIVSTIIIQYNYAIKTLCIILIFFSTLLSFLYDIPYLKQINLLIVSFSASLVILAELFYFCSFSKKNK